MELYINLTEKQIERLSEIVGNLGLLFFASLVLPTFSLNNQFDARIVTSGLIVTLMCVFSSIILAGGELYE